MILPALEQRSVVLRHLQPARTTAPSVHLQKITDGSVGWFAEGSVIDDVGAAADMIEVVPKKVAGIATISNESVADSGAADLIGQTLARSLALAVDTSFFLTKVSGPVSLAAATVTAHDASPTSGLDVWVDAATIMERAGSQPSVIFLSPLDRAILAKIKEATGSNKPVLVPPATPGVAADGSLNGVPAEICSAIPQRTGYLIDGERVGAVIRTDGNVAVDGSAGFASDVTLMRVTGRFGGAVIYPDSVVRIKDVA